MKKAIRVFAALVVIASLCVGCGKADKSESEAVEQPKASNAKNWEPETAKQPKASNAKNGEPETAKQPKAHSSDDGQDHSGHNH